MQFKNFKGKLLKLESHKKFKTKNIAIGKLCIYINLKT